MTPPAIDKSERDTSRRKAIDPEAEMIRSLAFITEEISTFKDIQREELASLQEQREGELESLRRQIAASAKPDDLKTKIWDNIPGIISALFAVAAFYSWSQIEITLLKEKVTTLVTGNGLLEAQVRDLNKRCDVKFYSLELKLDRISSKLGDKPSVVPQDNQ